MKADWIRTTSLFIGFLIVTTIGLMVGKDMLNKPFKISHVADFYESFAFYGTAISLIISLAASWFLRRQMPTLLVPVIPTLIFPFTVWTVYQIAFFISGNEVGFERTDLSPLTAEIELSYILIRAGALGVSTSFVVGALASYIERR